MGGFLFGSIQGIVLLLVALHLAIDIVAWAITLPEEGSLERIRSAVKAMAVVGGVTFFLTFFFGVMLFRLDMMIRDSEVFGNDNLNHYSFRWPFYAAGRFELLYGDDCRLGRVTGRRPDLGGAERSEQASRVGRSRGSNGDNCLICLGRDQGSAQVGKAAESSRCSEEPASKEVETGQDLLPLWARSDESSTHTIRDVPRKKPYFDIVP